MTKKVYTLVGRFPRINDTIAALRYENLRFEYEINNSLDSAILLFNISDDMVSEVEELLKNTAEKCGVKLV